jgi:hypothetical protein
MVTSLVLALTVLICVAFWSTWCLRQCRESLAATRAECDAGEAFTDWRLRNPSVSIGLSEEGRTLVDRWLKAQNWFSRTHKHMSDLNRKRREFILSFLS